MTDAETASFQENARQILERFEGHLHELADEFRRSFLAAREARLKYRSLPAALFEQSNSVGAGEPELTATYRAIAERWANDCRQRDIDLSLLLPACRFDFVDLRPPAEEFAAIAEARAAISSALAPLFRQRAEAMALAAANAQRLADARQAVANAQQQLDDAQRREREPTVTEAEQELAIATERLKAIADPAPAEEPAEQ
ncbi:hypothetical protein [Rhodoblastus sp.]|uniref:hypothetical protein n=1 Tax=Rhodoblastus sp. TaxID=1962975 RepID=UPI003F9767D2